MNTTTTTVNPFAVGFFGLKRLAKECIDALPTAMLAEGTIWIGRVAA